MSINPLCCFKACFQGVPFTDKPHRWNPNPIVLDGTNMGHEVVIIKDGLRICGTGGALCTAPLVQSKSYFEVKVQQAGIWGVGLATRQCDLNKPPGGKDAESWVLSSEGCVSHQNSSLHSNIEVPPEGSIIGVSYDHLHLNFYVDGKPLEKPVSGIRGDVYPVLFVDEGAVLDLIVEHFHFPIPMGFERILLEQSLL